MHHRAELVVWWEVNDEIGVHVIHQGVGPVLPSDIDKAETAGAQIVGFGVPMAGKVRAIYGGSVTCGGAWH